MNTFSLLGYNKRCKNLTSNLDVKYCQTHYEELKKGCIEYHLVNDIVNLYYDELIDYTKNKNPSIDDHIKALRLMFKMQFVAMKELGKREDHRDLMNLDIDWGHMDFNSRVFKFGGISFEVQKDLQNSKRIVICRNNITNIFSFLVKYYIESNLEKDLITKIKGHTINMHENDSIKVEENDLNEYDLNENINQDIPEYEEQNIYKINEVLTSTFKYYETDWGLNPNFEDLNF